MTKDDKLIDHPIINGGALQSVLLDGTVVVNFEIEDENGTHDHDLKLDKTTPMTCMNVGHFEHLANIKAIRVGKQEETFVPPNFSAPNNPDEGCSFDDGENPISNKCSNHSDCSGDRICDGWGWCVGDSNCPNLSF